MRLRLFIALVALSLVLKKRGNVATLLSGRLKRTAAGARTSIQHAGLVYRCAPDELAAYRREQTNK